MNKPQVVGVSYGPDEKTPTIILKGSGAEAGALVAAARRNDTPVVHAPELTRHLYRNPIDTPVSKELFPVMALLLAHVMQADRDQKENTRE